MNTLLLKNMYFNAIYRFQNISAQPYANDSLDAAGLPLVKQYTDNTKTAVRLPVYAFNLTSSPITVINNTTASSAPTLPFYRLIKIINATGTIDAGMLNYVWEPAYGTASDGATASAQWQLEKSTGATTVLQARTHGTYIHEWSAVDIIANQTDNNNTRKMHIATASFPIPEAGPLRLYNDGSGFVTTDVNTTQQGANRSDLWWDHFLATKLVHPSRHVQAMTNNKAVNIINSECLCLENEAVLRKSYFLPNKTMYTCTDPVKAEVEHRPDINTAADINGRPIPNWNVNQSINTGGPFPPRNKDTWMLIYADDFSKILPHDNTENIPLAFQICARGKYAYSLL